MTWPPPSPGSRPAPPAPGRRALGASELGTCRRRTAYRLAGTVETNPGGGMTAALGTWIHKGALDVLRREYGALIEVRLASPLIRGKADALYPDAGVVEDLKTKGRYVYAQTVDTGPRIGELFQVSIYGWLLREGHIADRRRGYPTGPVPVDTVRLRYLDRDTGASHVVGGALRPSGDRGGAGLARRRPRGAGDRRARQRCRGTGTAPGCRSFATGVRSRMPAGVRRRWAPSRGPGNL
jgi:hypothetical protein